MKPKPETKKNPEPAMKPCKIRVDVDDIPNFRNLTLRCSDFCKGRGSYDFGKYIGTEKGKIIKIICECTLDAHKECKK